VAEGRGAQQQQQYADEQVQGQSTGGEVGETEDSNAFVSKLPPAAVRKRAWLVSPEILRHQQQQLEQRQRQQEQGLQGDHGQPLQATGQDDWELAPDFVCAQQHLQQSEGWDASWEVLQQAVAELGPFDGVLGFSQVCRGCEGPLHRVRTEGLWPFNSVLGLLQVRMEQHHWLDKG